MMQEFGTILNFETGSEKIAMPSIIYNGPIVCETCGTITTTTEKKCHCNDDSIGGKIRPNFKPYDPEPYKFIAVLRNELKRLCVENDVTSDYVHVGDNR
jgi:hypothetical protein